jgi:hypothetical protein
MSLIIVRHPVDLQLYCDEAGTASVAADGFFVTAAAAFAGEHGPRDAKWAAWLRARGLEDTKGRRWPRHGKAVWSDLAAFLIANDIHPIVGRSRATEELEEAARAKAKDRSVTRAEAGLPEDEGISARDMLWVYQMVTTTTLGTAVWAMAEAPVRSLAIAYDEFQLGPVAARVAEGRVGLTTGPALADEMTSRPVTGADPLGVFAHDRMLRKRLLWGRPTFRPVAGRHPWCRMADGIAAWRRLALAGDPDAIAAWTDLERALSWPGTDRPRRYLDLDVTEAVLELAQQRWPTS